MSSSWVSVGGTTFVNPELSKKVRMVSRYQTKMYQVVDPASEFNIGKKSGESVSIRVRGRHTVLSTTALTEFQPIPLQDSPEYYVTATAYRRGAGTAYTGVRADLDRIDTESEVIEALRDQAARTKDKVIYDILVAAHDLWYVALTASTFGFGTNGTPSGTEAVAFTRFHLNKLILKATQYNIPYFDGSNYVFLCSPIIEENVQNDTATNGFVDVAKYDPSRVQGLLAGEFGKLGKVRMVMDNSADLTAWDGVGTGSAFGTGFLCGGDFCKEIMVYPMHFRFQENLGQDFGNQHAIGWQELCGYKVLWNYTAHGQSSFIHYTTA